MGEVRVVRHHLPHGLRGLWHRIRASVLRVRSRPSLHSKSSKLSKPIHSSNTDESVEFSPIEPVGVTTRVSQAGPATRGLDDPIRKGLSHVPPLPHVVRELLRELGDPTSNARSVARIAASDPALAAGLIRTVNSASMGLRKKVSSVTDAVSFLGYTTVRALVIRTRLDRVFPTHGLQSVYDAEDLWVHSLAVSYAAETLADRVPGVDRGFVSTLGLLHDIGKLAINSYFPHSAAQLRKQSPDHPGESFLDRERRVLGGDHAEIGAVLAQHWKLPSDLGNAIQWHHTPLSMPATLSQTMRNATALVHLANQMAKYCYVYSEDMEVDIVPAELLRQVGLPGPMTRLMGNQVRRAISRAVFFADESTAGGSGRSLGMVRRFLRLHAQGQAPSELPPTVFGRPGITLVEDDWDQNLGAELLRVDVIATAKTRMEMMLANPAHAARFAALANPQGIEALREVVIRHLDHLPIDESLRLPARFLLRRLLNNLMEIGPCEPIEVALSLSGGMISVSLRSPALSFARRFGSTVSPRRAAAGLARELANILNLRWFAKVQTSRDGELLIFQNHLTTDSRLHGTKTRD